jgi:hypothetical protein
LSCGAACGLGGRSLLGCSRSWASPDPQGIGKPGHRRGGERSSLERPGSRSLVSLLPLWPSAVPGRASGVFPGVRFAGVLFRLLSCAMPSNLGCPPATLSSPRLLAGACSCGFHRPSAAQHLGVHSRALSREGPSALRLPTGASRSTLALSQRLDGLRLARLCGSVAPRCRLWDSPDFNPLPAARCSNPEIRAVRIGAEAGLPAGAAHTLRRLPLSDSRDTSPCPLPS